MADFPLHPTPTRLALLADIAAGRVIDNADFAPHLHFDGNEPPARVAAAVWEMRSAGWCEQTTTDRKWSLTAAGTDVLQGRVPDA